MPLWTSKFLGLSSMCLEELPDRQPRMEEGLTVRKREALKREKQEKGLDRGYLILLRTRKYARNSKLSVLQDLTRLPR